MMMRVVLLSSLSPVVLLLAAAAAIIIICLDDDGVSAAVTVVAAASFAADNTPSSSRRRTTTPKTTSSSPPPDILEDLMVEQEETKPGRTNLRFQASTNYATKPFFSAAIGNNDNDDDSNMSLMMQEFFFRDSTRDMLLAGGGDDDNDNSEKKKNRIELLPSREVDPALYRMWQIEVDKSNRSGFEEPSKDDDDCSSILRVTTNAINFPGLLRLSTCATVGCKKVINNDNNLPELQITLIKDELQAEGPEPLVWVFNQLTGGGSRNRKDDNNNKVRGGPALFGLNIAPPPQADSSSERKTHSTNSIRVEKTTTNDDGMFVFRSVAQLTIDVSFPTLLLRILPVSKAMAERQGSIAIRNVVERDIGPSLEALRDRYIHEMK